MAVLLNRTSICCFRSAKFTLQSTHNFCQEAKGRKSAPANKVKRPLSGFGTFLSKEYPAEKVKDGSIRPREVMKIVAQKWYELSEEEKKAYAATPEMWENYRNYRKSLQETKSNLDKDRTKAFKKARTEVYEKLGKPKQPANSFLMFSSDMANSSPKAKVTRSQLMVEISEKWAALSAEEKEVYEKRSLEERKEYQEKMFIWEEEMKAKGFPEVCKDYPGKKSRALEKAMAKLNIVQDNVKL